MTEQVNKNNQLLLGCIADDITGASDIGLMLASHGLPTTLYLGVPDAAVELSTEAAVIALKIRTVASVDAVMEATAAADWLLSRNTRQLFYKYCSTFDSTSSGNIGPISDALLERLDDDFTVILPAFPGNGRTVRAGHLYVDDVPLNESSMRDHPLTPMTESYLPAMMDAQTRRGLSTHIDQEIVDAGENSIREAIRVARKAGKRYASIDTMSNKDLQAISDAIADLKLITGAAGIAGAIPETLRANGNLDPKSEITLLPEVTGNAAILAGSCSQATRRQISMFKNTEQGISIDPMKIAAGVTDKRGIADRALLAAARSDVLVYSSAAPENLRAAQESLGVAKSAEIIEETLAFVARRLSDSGIRKFIVAGGETSGAVATALGITELRVGEEIDPGVPWMVTPTSPPTWLAFKSGNFGRPDFFRHALDMLK